MDEEQQRINLLSDIFIDEEDYDAAAKAKNKKLCRVGPVLMDSDSKLT